MQQSEGGNAVFPTQTVADIVAAYVSNNHVAVSELPALISTVASEMAKLSGIGAVEAEVEKREPAVSIKKAVTPDYIVDLFTGKRFKSLKRHIRTTHNMSPEEYRAYWGLPTDFPMVAPAYAAQRSALAKSMGLGIARRTKVTTAAETPTKVPRARKAPASPPKIEESTAS